MHISWLEITFRFMDSRLKSLTEYISKNNEWLLIEQSKLKNNIDKWEKENPDAGEYGYDSYTHFEDDIQTIFKDFNDAANGSLLLIAYSYFEVTMKNICLETEKYINSKIGLNDLSGANYIEKSKKFVSKLLDIDINDLEDKWIIIKDYQKIRNLIAHSNGRISESQLSNLKRISREYGNIKVTKGIQPEIKIESPDFIIRFCEVADDYISEIMKRVLIKLKSK